MRNLQELQGEYHMLDIYAIKTDGLRYYAGQCRDEDETVDAVLKMLSAAAGHRDTVRFEIVGPPTTRAELEE